MAPNEHATDDLDTSTRIPERPTQYRVTICYVEQDAAGEVTWRYDNDFSTRFASPVPTPSIGELVIVGGTLYRLVDIGWEYLGIHPADECIDDLFPLVEMVLFLEAAENIGTYLFPEEDSIA